MFGKPFNLSEDTIGKVSEMMKERSIHLSERFDNAALEVAGKLIGMPFETRTKTIKEAYYAACETSAEKVDARIAKAFSSAVMEHFDTLSEKKCKCQHNEEEYGNREDEDEMNEKCGKKHYKEEKKDSEYQKFFKSMLKKHGYDSLADVPKDKTGDLFNKIDKAYKADNE